MTEEKRCWMCKRTKKQIMEEYDLKSFDANSDGFEKDEQGKPISFEWWHNVCVVCADIIKAVIEPCGYVHESELSELRVIKKDE